MDRVTRRRTTVLLIRKAIEDEGKERPSPADQAGEFYQP
jgi:hypothetical protein